MLQLVKCRLAGTLLSGAAMDVVKDHVVKVEDLKFCVTKAGLVKLRVETDRCLTNSCLSYSLFLLPGQCGK